MGRGLGQMLAILKTALAHDIQKQDAALPGVHQILEGRCENPGQRGARNCRLVGCHAQISHSLQQPMRQDCAWAEETFDIGQGSPPLA